MTELSPDARNLLRQSRASFTPSRAELEAVCQTVQARAAAAAFTQAPDASGVRTSAWSSRVVIRRLAAISLVAGASLALVLALRPSAERPAKDTALRERPLVEAPGPELNAPRAPLALPPDPTNGEQNGLAAPASRRVAERAGAVDRRMKLQRAPANGSRGAPAPLSAAVAGAAAKPTPSAVVSPDTTQAIAESMPTPAPAERAAASIPAPPQPAEFEQSSMDTLAQELHFLRSAQTALDRGDGALALVLLERHTMRFPKGVLRQERLAALVSTLCMLRRVEEAKATLRQLTSIAPNSPHLARLRNGCARAARP